MHRRPSSLAVVLLSLVGAAFTPAPALAQDGAVSGTVTDTTGLVLPGVTVEARAPGGPPLTAATDAAGVYTIGGLGASAYELTFTLPGFQTVVRGGVAVGAGATATLEDLRGRIDAQGKDMSEQVGQLRERMAHLEGLREAITRRAA